MMIVNDKEPSRRILIILEHGRQMCTDADCLTANKVITAAVGRIRLVDKDETWTSTVC